MARDTYVIGAHQLCADGRCQFAAAAGILRQADEIMRGRDHMSQALWCDQGGHAFSERDPGRQRITVNTLDENEDEIAVSKDFCGECAAQAGLTTPRRTRPARMQVTGNAVPQDS